MPYKDPEAKKAWRERNVERQRQYQLKHNEVHRERYEAQRAARREVARLKRASRPSAVKMPKYQKDYRSRIRTTAIQILGGACERCGFNDARALQFDHKVPILRKSKGVGRKSVTPELSQRIKDGTLCDVFQLLCANCHVIKTRDGGEYSMRADSFAAPSPSHPSPLPLFGSFLPH